jgi:hypothetical protein
VIDIAEGAFGYPVTEVVAPAPQHRVQSAQQVCERSVFRSASELSDLVDDGTTQQNRTAAAILWDALVWKLVGSLWWRACRVVRFDNR